ncbi:MAG: aminoacyl-tRNA hydrolase [Candidatus Sungbacteria bacterium]|uniref:Aminoacyl-tRNA hydrolase n=1 Tax=Candidatus Sungiibacteriota bacterium TaxID=2750080 RepID=A0A931SDS1_9BACT|nr:aminoacyl-tRNA hydrolase [Candidatus Sungbacteria bacterium]
MILLIGLGNPGKDYEGTRHNIGRDTVLAFIKKHGFGAPTPNEKLKALLSEGKLGKERYIVILPETFMNKSGQAAQKAQLAFKPKPDRIFVVHDDADIELGRTKLSFNRDSAGHKGVESVMRALGTKKFWRFRIGIGPPQPKNLSLRGQRKWGDWSTVKNKKKRKRIPAEDLVLKRFSPAEESLMKKARLKTVGALGELTNDPPEKVMNHYNK